MSICISTIIPSLIFYGTGCIRHTVWGVSIWYPIDGCIIYTRERICLANNICLIPYWWMYQTDGCVWHHVWGVSIWYPIDGCIIYTRERICLTNNICLIPYWWIDQTDGCVWRVECLSDTSSYVMSHTHPSVWYGVATISRMLKNIGLFCKRDLQKRPIFYKKTYILKHPTHRSHPIPYWWMYQTDAYE